MRALTGSGGIQSAGGGLQGSALGAGNGVGGGRSGDGFGAQTGLATRRIRAAGRGPRRGERELQR